MNAQKRKKHIRSRRSLPLRVLVFVVAIILPTILLGYLAIRTADIERVLIWEKLKESYTSLAKLVSEQLDDMLYSAENDLRDSLLFRPSYNSSDLAQLAHQLEARHGVMGQVFFLDSSGQMVYPENPQKKWRDARQMDQRTTPGEEDADVFQFYMAKAERQEFKFSNPQRAINLYQRVLDNVEEPTYQLSALNGIARCYTKLGLDRKAADYYNEIIDGYADVNGGDVEIAAIAYLQCASIHAKIGNIGMSIATFMEFYGNLSENRWDVDCDEIWYFADKTRRQLLVYRDAGDERFTAIADKFAELDTKVFQQARLHQFLRDYRRLASREMTQIVSRAARKSESAEHLLNSTDTGPHFISYITLDRENDASGQLTEGDVVVAGFEVDLFYLASEGFREALARLTTRDDMVLAILNENDEVLGVHPRTPLPGEEMEYLAPELPGKPITVVTSSNFPFWRVGVYIKEPQSLESLSRRKANLRILAVAGLVLAIAFGIYLIIREERKEAELARLRSDFVANVSHELRTPLSSIQVLSETLKRGTPAGPDRQAQYLDTIASESSRLARLVANVLDFSKLERRIEEFNFRPTDVGEVVQSAVEAYRFYAEQRDAKIYVNIARDLPRIRADGEAISQLLINLVDNAVKYSEDEKDISVNVFHKGNNIVIQVTDRGIGIDEKDMRKIFDKFYRGKSAANLGTGGTGLGLTLARAIAAAHGGYIRVRSRKGAGSKFSVFLPLSKEVLT